MKSIIKKLSTISALVCFSSIVAAQIVTSDKVGTPGFQAHNIERKLVAKNSLRKPASPIQINSDVIPRIVGGTDAGIDAYPWMTALLVSYEPEAFYAQFCGGSLIRKDLVVTAAHCVDWLTDPSQIDVAVGAYNLTGVTGQDRIPVLGIFIHPDYDELLLDNDIAILKLARDASQTPVPVMDPSLMQALTPGDLLTVMGWGTLQEQTSFFPDTLQEVQVPLVDNLICEQALSISDPYVSLTENQICAGYDIGGKDSCQGDSGGPLVYPTNGQWYLTGIVSWGIGCARPDTYGVYTNASNYSDWVSQAADTLYIPAKHDFKTVGISENSEWVATVLNLSNDIIIVQDVSISGDSAYRITENNCLNKMLDPFNKCKFEIKFKPRKTGTKTATLTLLQNNGQVHTIELVGSALAKINANKALDTRKWTWYSGGDAAWTVDDIAGSVNSSAMRSGIIDDNQASHIMTYIEGPGELTFRWKVSSEAKYDYFYLLIDGQLANYISGEVDWQTETIAIGKGTHAIAWSYTKDEYYADGVDAAWLDNVTWKRTGETSGKFDRAGLNKGANENGGGGSLTWPLLLVLIVSRLLMLRNRKLH